MEVCIIGAGNMGRGIGTRIVAGQNSLTILDKNGEKARELASDLGGNTIGGVLDQSIDGEVVIFALPYNQIFEVIKKYKDQLSGKIMVDISIPVDFQTFELLTPTHSFAAEEIAKVLEPGARLVKAFNTTFAGTLVKGEVDGKPLDVFIASDDKDAGEKIVQLANEGRLRGLYVGPLKLARCLEEMQQIQMKLQEKLNTNWMSTIKILP